MIREAAVRAAYLDLSAVVYSSLSEGDLAPHELRMVHAELDHLDAVTRPRSRSCVNRVARALLDGYDPGTWPRLRWALSVSREILPASCGPETHKENP